MKQVWVNSATWARTASTTRGAELPIVVTAMPEPRSMSRLPSTSSTMPPAARAANTGMVLPTLADTAAARRLVSFSDVGPGISVTRWRLCSTASRQQPSRASRSLAEIAAATSPERLISLRPVWPNSRHTLVVGSQYWPGSQFSGCGPWPSGRHTFPVGSQYWPGSQFAGGSAELTDGIAHAKAAAASSCGSLPIGR